MNWTIFGIVAGLISSSGFIPQIIKGYRTKELEDLSYIFLAIALLGAVMWLIYGFSFMNPPLIVTNTIVVCTTVTVLVMKYLYSKK